MPHPTVVSVLGAFAITLTATALGGLEDQPLLPSDSVAPVSTIFERQYTEFRPGGNFLTSRGIAFAVDSAGNIYMASGASMSKYSPAGAVLWQRTHENRVVTVNSGGLTQTNYYETWDNNQ